MITARLCFHTLRRRSCFPVFIRFLSIVLVTSAYCYRIFPVSPLHKSHLRRGSVKLQGMFVRQRFHQRISAIKDLKNALCTVTDRILLSSGKEDRRSCLNMPVLHFFLVLPIAWTDIF